MGEAWLRWLRIRRARHRRWYERRQRMRNTQRLPLQRTLAVHLSVFPVLSHCVEQHTGGRKPRRGRSKLCNGSQSMRAWWPRKDKPCETCVSAEQRASHIDSGARSRLVAVGILCRTTIKRGGIDGDTAGCALAEDLKSVPPCRRRRRTPAPQSRPPQLGKVGRAMQRWKDVAKRRPIARGSGRLRRFEGHGGNSRTE